MALPWGPAVDQILAEEAVDNGSDETVQWTLTDHLNTVRDIAQCDPDDDMTTVVNHLIDDAFGRVTSEANPAVESLFLFTARPFDAATGLQNNLNRWYDSAVGRWLSEDPIGYLRGQPNLFCFVDNSPQTATDPFGLQTRENLDRHDQLVQYHRCPYLKATLLVDSIRDHNGCPAIRLRVRLRRLFEVPNYREDIWNKLQHEVPDEWNREVWGTDNEGNKWLRPNLAMLLNGAYGGWDPVKRVANDYVMVIIRHYDAENREVGEPQSSREWHVIGNPSREVSHVAGTREFRIRPRCGYGTVKVWVVFCDTWGFPLYPGSPPEGPTDAFGDRAGCSIAYFEVHYRHGPGQLLKWSLSGRTSGIPPTEYDYDRDLR